MVWLIVAGVCLAGFALTVAVVVYVNVWVGGLAGAAIGAGLMQLILHVRRLTKQPI